MPKAPKPNIEAQVESDIRIDASLKHHTRQTLNDIADQVEVLTHAVAALDTAMAEVTADAPDSIRASVVAAGAALLQVGTSMLAVSRGLGKLDFSSTVSYLPAGRCGSLAEAVVSTPGACCGHGGTSTAAGHHQRQLKLDAPPDEVEPDHTMVTASIDIRRQVDSKEFELVEVGDLTHVRCEQRRRRNDQHHPSATLAQPFSMRRNGRFSPPTSRLLRIDG